MDIPSLVALNVTIEARHPRPSSEKKADAFFERLRQRKLKSIAKRDSEWERAEAKRNEMIKRATMVHEQRKDEIRMETKARKSAFPQSIFIGFGTWPTYTFDKLDSKTLAPTSTSKTLSIDNRLVIWCSRDFDPMDQRKAQWYTLCLDEQNCGEAEDEWFISVKDAFRGRIMTGDMYISMNAFMGMHWKDLYWIKKESELHNIYVFDIVSTRLSNSRWAKYVDDSVAMRNYKKRAESTDDGSDDNPSLASTDATE